MKILPQSHRIIYPLLIPALLLMTLPMSPHARPADPTPAAAIEIVEESPERIVISYKFNEPLFRYVEIDGRLFSEPRLGSESLIKRIGSPSLPGVSRSILIPDNAGMIVNVLNTEFHEVEDVDILPSRGNIPREIDPATVPYTFGDVYRDDCFYPELPATIHTPYIMRDHRGLLVTVHPLQYNPVKRVLRVCSRITIEVKAAGPGRINVLDDTTRREPSRSFHQLYTRHFINYGNSNKRYEPLDETGDLLIISHDPWLSILEPFRLHKESLGIHTTILPVSAIGNDSASIHNCIRDFYDTTDLSFVILAGDAAQVATPHWSVPADPLYTLLAGDDPYPEIMLGRFSAQTADELETQVERTIEYECLPATDQEWFWRGMGIASDDGPGDEGEMDWEHVDNIRDDLLAYGYTKVDRIYDPDAEKALVTDGVNEGRGIVSYCGHGAPLGWTTTGFGNDDVDALVNENKLPFVLSLACNPGRFEGLTCFAEAWMRATHDGEPTGAIGVYASAQGQYWDPPMAAHDETIDLFTSETYTTLGTLCYAGSCLMMDEYYPPYPEGGGVEMFYVWILFGDPSLRIVRNTGMRVTPIGGLDSRGDAGGPFTPDSVVYTLRNHGAIPIEYSVTEQCDWIDLSSRAGTIPGLGETEITVSLNSLTAEFVNGRYDEVINFINLTNHDGDISRRVQLSVGGIEPVYMFDLDSNPGWSATGEWAFGAPSGTGGVSQGYPDPLTGATGDSVYGINLNGDYSTQITGPQYLTTNAIDCSNLTDITLQFQQWLNTDYRPYIDATLCVSTDSAHWEMLWQNMYHPDSTTENTWSLRLFDIADLADNQPALYIRWGHEVLRSDAWIYSGWNIDDICVSASPISTGINTTPRPGPSVFLSPPAPNPGRGSIAFQVHTPTAGPLDLRVVDITGRVVRRLHRGTITPGLHDFFWDTRKENGRQTASGVYFIVADGVVQASRKVVVVR